MTDWPLFGNILMRNWISFSEGGWRPKTVVIRSASWVRSYVDLVADCWQTLKLKHLGRIAASDREDFRIK